MKVENNKKKTPTRFPFHRIPQDNTLRHLSKENNLDSKFLFLKKCSGLL